jgi:hypothetical protein
MRIGSSAGMVGMRSRRQPATFGEISGVFGSSISGSVTQAT